MKFDLLVIGSGPAGQKAALQGAKAGKKVAVIDYNSKLGGGCVHSGTLPSKSFRESVYRWSLGSQGTIGRQMRGKSNAAPTSSALPDMARLLERARRVIANESEIVAAQFKRNGVQVYCGRAQFQSPHEVQVLPTDGGPAQVLTGKNVVIAVGSGPAPLEHLPVDGELVFDSNNILELKKVPRSMVVFGAGVIGCEYASMFATAGTQVTLVDKRHEILAAVDREIVSHLLERFDQHQMKTILKTEATRLERIEGKIPRLRVHLANGESVETDAALVALGRIGNTQNLALEKAGLKADPRGLIEVDENFQTQVKGIYAVGDVIGAPALASTSMEQGRVACCHAFGIKGETSVGLPEYFPYGIYTIPEISMVGESEEALKAKNIPIVTGIARYKEMARGQIVGDQWGLLKLIVDRSSLKILGVHIIGDNAAELVHVGQTVMAFGGRVDYFIRNVFNYPTFAEAYKTAAFHAVNQLR